MLLPLLVLLGGTPAPPACDSTVFRAPIATVTDTLVLTIRRADGSGRALPSPWAELTLQAVAEHLALPRPVRLPVWTSVAAPSARPTRAALTRAAADTVAPTLANTILAVVTPAGRLREDPARIAASLDQGADLALVRALRAADSARVLPPASDGRRDALHVFVGYAIAGRGGGVDSAARAHPLSLVRRDVHVLSETPWPVPGTRGPAYPPGELANNVPGDATLEFVLDEHGVPFAHTLRPVRYTGWGFARAALEFVPGARFTPARVGGCGVPMLVRQPFEFRLTR
ncbi:hypothetical protein [Roseisolibacter sp. H3M3-2]|uniref:hypothetical protein n=1 Tax=Roseisolibacter sp. H3M3-2 TaxID=3031323 RepID=UPI0023DAA263|nr:hypothetical protein [Roseisolibacter sp. H3M3-2]MDF1502544.1 hypothetical protein [Roseisolibacter sp. H3M3-2]